MAEAISPLSSSEMRLTQILGEDDLLAQAPAAPAAPGQTSKVLYPGNAFDDILAKTIESLNQVSQSEMYANNVIEGYARGEVDLQEVMVAQAKMNIMMQLAVTSINTAVTTFKEITQLQI